MFKKLIASLMLTLTLVACAAAQKANKPAGGVEKKDVGAVVPSGVVEKKVAKLTDELHWFSSLAEAKALAKKENKPIFWLHALGDLDGVC